MSTKFILFKRVVLILAIPILLVGVALLALTVPVHGTSSASTISVTTTVDEFGTGSDCSLREAIESANTDGDFGGCLRNGSAPYTITLLANTYTLTGIPGEDDNQTGDLDLRASMNIVGNGAESTIIQAGNTLNDSFDRVFHITTDTPMVTIANLTIQHGNLEYDNGGGILNEGTLVITGSQIMNNSADLGGGINNRSQNSTSTVTLTIFNSTISHNSAYLGGGIGNYGDGDSNSNATVTISGSLISHNNSDDFGNGGGIDNYNGQLELTDSTISHNSGALGGGINNLASGENSNATVTLNGSTISHNSAEFGGGIRNLDDNGHAMVTLNSSTISQNSAGYAGGIDNSDHLEISNSTISDNSAGFGGGIVNYADSYNIDATVTLNGSTISGNSADDVGGIVNSADSDNDSAMINLKNTIIASNTSSSGQADDCSGTLDSYGYNFIQESSDCTIVDVENASTNMTGQEALLGALNDNDGPTETHALLSGSPAIDSGSCTDIDGNPLSTDQRGYPRPQGTTCDMGSFEVSELANIALAPSQFELTLAEGSHATETLTISNLGMGQLEWTSSQDVAWLSASPMSGTVTAGSSTSLTLSIDASNLTPNNYTGRLSIMSNDLANPSLEVLLSLTVTDKDAILVTTTVDEFGTGSDCSLREAIESANTDGDFGGCLRNGSAPYTITLLANTYTLTGSAGEDDNQTGDLDLRASMNIVGNGAESTIIQAGNTLNDSFDRVFHITTDTPMVTIANLTIQHGNLEYDNGGGILNEGTLVITGSQIMNNSAELGGGINNRSQNSTSTVTLTIFNSTISHNSAYSGGGIGNYAEGGSNSNATITISGSIISHNNSGDFGNGGGIDNYNGQLELTGSTISHNSGNLGGGINNLGENGNATVTLNRSTISHNSAAYGGGIRNLDDNGHATVTINSSTISHNSAGYAGGIDNSDHLEISNSTISDNSAEFGGGIVNYPNYDGSGTVTINFSTISGNSADNVGGIVNYADGYGGSNVHPTVTINFSTISGNSADDVGGIRNYASGDNAHATVTLNASTISGNSAIVGGILNDASGDNGTVTVNKKKQSWQAIPPAAVKLMIVLVHSTPTATTLSKRPATARSLMSKTLAPT